MDLQNWIEDTFCDGGLFWDSNQVWNATTPRFTKCFQNTLPIWLPAVILWAFAPYCFASPRKFSSISSMNEQNNATKIFTCLIIVFVNGIKLAVDYLGYVSDSDLHSGILVADLTGLLINVCTFTLFAFLLDHNRKIGTNSSLEWIFTFTSLIGSIPTAYMFSMHFWDPQTFDLVQKFDSIEFGFFAIHFFGLGFLFVQTCFFAKIVPSSGECPELRASFLSKVTYWWFNSLTTLGYSKELKLDDLWQVEPENRSKNISEKFDQNWNSQGQAAGTFTTLVKTFGLTYLGGSVFKLAYVLLQLIYPQILKYFIDFISNPDEPFWHGFLYASLLFTISMLQSILNAHYIRVMFTIGHKIEYSLVSAIYRKALTLSSAARHSTPTGKILDLLSVDASHFVGVVLFMGMIWAGPLQICLAIYFLWLELGPSILVGIVLMIGLMPLNWHINKFQYRYYTAQMKSKDERINVINEILRGIRVIKLYAWEKPFMSKVSDLREQETGQMKMASYLAAFNSMVMDSSAFWVSFAAFAVYVLSSDDNILDAKKVFVSLSLFELLRNPLSILPPLIGQYTVTSVSIGRLNEFLNADELKNYVTRVEKMNNDNEIVIENGRFSWGSSKTEKNLEKNDESVQNVYPEQLKINLTVKKGSLTAIVGQVGSGKSSLLSAILGEMELLAGSVELPTTASIAYVAQQAWIRNGTLRDNILFGSEYNEKRYKKILEICALSPDIDILPAGDLTEIGEKGINLSGGQKQRVALARACYSKADIILLDDPLSAVDSHVAAHIFRHVISDKSNGYLGGKTRLLVTNNVNFLSEVDQIVLLENGAIIETGTYEKLVSQNGGKLASLIKEFSNDLCKNVDDTEVQIEHSETKESTTEEQTEKDQLIQEEQTKSDKVKWSIYTSYLRSITLFWFILILIGFIGSQLAKVGSELWLALWTNQHSNGQSINSTITNTKIETESQNKHLIVYGLLGLLQAGLYFFGSIALTSGTIKSSIALHSRLVNRVMHCPVQFFDTTPMGRIVNRFSKDIDTVDSKIPSMIQNWIFGLFRMVSVLAMILFQVPVFIFVILPILVLYRFIQNYYIATSRQLTRLSSVTYSPILAHLDESFSGVSTIRAFGAESRFINESHSRIDTRQRTFYPSMHANRWLSLRLEFCSNLLILFVALFSVASKSVFYDRPGFIALLLTYASGITDTVSSFIRSSSDLESSIVAVERIEEYSESIAQEKEWTRSENVDPIIPENWPVKGEIDFVNYSLKYRANLESVLHDISIKVKSGEKIGIVGRTGAGKSSLTLGLFRILESSSGRITIDGVDIAKIGLHELRSKVSIIPQDPTLFSGTIRSNLDPFNRHTNEQIWWALKHSYLHDYITSLESGLEHQVSENGENLSVGQRQLMCLSRALLRKTKILILDEATAAIDLETDSLIQRTIREQFSDCTVLTIAHRLNTVMDSDRVLVLHQGRVVEFDTPKALIENTNSRFYSLAKDAKIV